MLKHYKNRGFSNFCVLCCSKRRKTKIDNWTLWSLLLFLSKNGRFATGHVFSNIGLLNPYFIVFGGSRFLGQVVKKGNFELPPKNRKKRLITAKLIFWYFSPFCFFFCFFVFCFFGGLNGHVRWPAGPPHLALIGPKPSLFFGVCFVVFLFFFVFLKMFHPKKRHFCLLVSVSLSFSLAFCFIALMEIVMENYISTRYL